MKKVRWGVVGAGGIAKVFCNALQFSTSGTLGAIASNTVGKASQLADLFGCDQAYEDYDSLFADRTIDAVYVATIHSLHLQPVLAALTSGKHVLVEKPISTNIAEAFSMIAMAREQKLFLMEGFMYRCHPQIEKLVELIQNGCIGDVRFIRSDFGYAMPFSAEARNFDQRLGGGGILDVGCYPVSMSRMIAGAASGQSFLNPMEVQAAGVKGPTGVDHYASAVLKFENDILAAVTAAITCDIPPTTIIYGSEGILTVPDPWLPSSPCRDAKFKLPATQSFPNSKLVLAREGETSIDFDIFVDRDLFSYEIDAVGQCIISNQNQCEKMGWDDTIGNMNTISQWLAAIGVEY